MVSVCLHLILLLLITTLPGAAPRRMNVLFIVADDLRAELGPWLDPQWPEMNPRIHTPAVDALAQRSLVLRRAYVQQAVCNPSRTSVLTGRRPDTTKVHDIVHYLRKVGSNFTTLPEYFKEHGYRTAGLGKVFHPGAPSGGNDPVSWTEHYFTPSNAKWGNYYNHTAWYAADVARTKKFPLVDQQIATEAKIRLHEYAEKARSGEQPFFLAVGFKKPHLPWLFPANYLDLYPLENVSLPRYPHAPQGMPEAAWANFPGLRHYPDFTGRFGSGWVNETFAPDYIVRELRRAYYASISYIDDLVGAVVDGVRQEGLENNTVITLWGDHGWQIGEHGEWEKHTNFELATRAPIMFTVPGVTDSGVVTDALTEFVDILPTVAEAAGLPVPVTCPVNSTHVTLCSEGISALPLASNPEQLWKSAAFSQYPRMSSAGDMIMGYTMRTDRYRYTNWVEFDNELNVQKPMWDLSHGTELYDHKVDPWENINLAATPGKEHTSLIKQLQRKLVLGWRNALPDEYSVNHAVEF